MRRRAVAAALVVCAVAVAAGAVAAAGTAGGLPPSPRNGLVAFVRCCGPAGVYVLAPAGGRARLLYEPANDDAVLTPTWSPNGRRLAYVGGVDAPGLWTVDARGRNRRRVTRGLGEAAFPTWSTNGAKIAFADRGTKGRNDVYVVRANGGGLARLTRTAADESRPAWAPDDTAILYERGDAIWTMRTNGTHQRRLVSDASSPAWSPGATHVAFVRNGDPWIAKRNGAAAHRVLHTGFETVDVAWSPDGRWLLAASADRGDLLAIRADGSASQPLQDDPGLFHGAPSWQRRPGS